MSESTPERDAVLIHVDLSTIEPCPACGDRIQFPEEISYLGSGPPPMSQIRCGNCGCSGPTALGRTRGDHIHSIAQAIAAWNEMPRQSSVEAQIADYLQWVRNTFPDETPEEQQEHLLEEVDELKKDFKKPDEYADVFMLLFCIASRHGIDILKAFAAKLAVNKQRTWQKTEKGFRHVKDELNDAEKETFKGYPHCPHCGTNVMDVVVERERLLRGDFTEDEFQNLCHKFQGADRQRFCDGCEAYQQKLFGSSPITELKARLSLLPQEGAEIHRLLHVLWGQAKEGNYDKPTWMNFQAALTKITDERLRG